MSSYDPDLEKLGALLVRHLAEELAEKTGESTEPRLQPRLGMTPL